MTQETIINKWVIIDDVHPIDSLNTSVIKRAKISTNNRYFFIYEEKNRLGSLLGTKIVLFDADKNMLWKYSSAQGRAISFKLSNIYDSILIIVETDLEGKEPMLWAIKNRKKATIVKKGQWERIINYIISPNYRYLIFNTRNSAVGTSWDYIYFFDLKTKRNWQYIFPVCIPCKRTKIELKVDNNGISEVIAKEEHRIFSRDGSLINFFYD